MPLVKSYLPDLNWNYLSKNTIMFRNYRYDTSLFEWLNLLVELEHRAFVHPLSFLPVVAAFNEKKKIIDLSRVNLKGNHWVQTRLFPLIYGILSLQTILNPHHFHPTNGVKSLTSFYCWTVVKLPCNSVKSHNVEQWSRPSPLLVALCTAEKGILWDVV